MAKVVAIVTARSGSKGLPGKNVRELGGVPLVAWPICAAKNSENVDAVYLSTDCPKIASIGEKWGALVPSLRPTELASDIASSFDVISNFFGAYPSIQRRYSHFLLLEPTSPFTQSADIDSAICKMKYDGIKSVVGTAVVEKLHPSYLYCRNKDGFIAPFLKTGNKQSTRRQDLSELFFLDGSLYLSCVDYYLKKGTFLHDRTIGLHLGGYKSIEIDTEMDFSYAEFCLHKFGIAVPSTGTIGA